MPGEPVTRSQPREAYDGRAADEPLTAERHAELEDDGSRLRKRLFK